MIVKNPNKETIRRVCSMFKCNNCWLLNEDGKPLSLLVRLDDSRLERFKEEQEVWSGFTFIIYNQNSPSEIIDTIKRKGELLVPVDTETPLKDLKNRQKPVRS